MLQESVHYWWTRFCFPAVILARYVDLTSSASCTSLPLYGLSDWKLRRQSSRAYYGGRTVNVNLGASAGLRKQAGHVPARCGCGLELPLRAAHEGSPPPTYTIFSNSSWEGFHDGPCLFVWGCEAWHMFSLSLFVGSLCKRGGTSSRMSMCIRADALLAFALCCNTV